MSFLSPLWLGLLALAPLALAAHFLAGRRARRYAVRFPALDTLARAVGGQRSWRRHVPAVLVALAACALALALARPQMTLARAVERASVVLVTDTSGSMVADDVEPTRMRAAQDAAIRFVDRVPDEMRVGLVSFAERAVSVNALTEDHDQVRAGVEALSAQGGTATGDGLRRALEELRRAREEEDPGPSAIVLLSDGRRTAGRDPLPVAREARRLGIVVHTVALGTPDGAVPDPRGFAFGRIPVPPDPGTLREIASIAGGRAFAVADAGELDAIYEQLGSRVGTREETREVSDAFAAGGLLLLLFGVGTSLRWRTQLP